VYDDTASTREPIQNYWQKLGIVKVVTKQMFEKPELIPEDLQQLFQKGISDQVSSQEQWKI